VYLIDSSCNTTITQNTFCFNTHTGLYLLNGHHNTIYHNNFIQNRKDVIDHSNAGDENHWDNGFPDGGNYWDLYSGIDVNEDGLGDTPFPIPPGNTYDVYPFMTQEGWSRVSPYLSECRLAGNGLITCPASDGPVYQYMTVIVRNFDGEPIPNIRAEEFIFSIASLGDTYIYGPLSCTFTPADAQINESGEIRFMIQGDTTIVGYITIQVTVLGISLNDVETLPCKSPDYFADGAVILGDFIIFAQDYGKSVYRSDFTWDGIVNMLDFVMFGQHWGHHHS
jgi:parallel beta-helix repeat protein